MKITVSILVVNTYAWFPCIPNLRPQLKFRHSFTQRVPMMGRFDMPSEEWTPTSDDYNPAWEDESEPIFDNEFFQKSLIMDPNEKSDSQEEFGVWEEYETDDFTKEIWDSPAEPQSKGEQIMFSWIDSLVFGTPHESILSDMQQNEDLKMFFEEVWNNFIEINEYFHNSGCVDMRFRDADLDDVLRTAWENLDRIMAESYDSHGKFWSNEKMVNLDGEEEAVGKVLLQDELDFNGEAHFGGEYQGNDFLSEIWKK